ncbi:FAD binding domain-containing protein [Hirsutella rhossiliensis]|uniref:FAD binding domain-containing protein n=1 Tax=Hirsutella rhossiliensis TaxID=111463 RepID=A0A9P8NB38_9HYPO|nr:FAD binding domain-containing protein [Hirsutella rhossiliensis]KAH0967902.1 FAD binding domain-containing protein [Hirsutella rhossiliensis]
MGNGQWERGPPSACKRKCKCLPQDSCWPRPNEWTRLNSTVGGRLVATVPLGSPCHDPQYDEGACEALRKDWLFPVVHIQSSSSVMAPLFANQSCEAFQPRSSACTLGNYVKYAVDARGPEDIAAALAFARKHNIRFLVRNTGHDFNGRSTGAGALAVRTHNLKGSRILDWKDKHYTGKALRIGSGTLGHEAAEAANRAGLVIVSGGCPSVGLAGGYIQGGGHSALSSVYGMAADNTLSFDVVLTSGRLVTASRAENQDLYWALSGGGGGTYGIVVSVTIRAHLDAKVGGASFSIEAPENNPDKIYDILDEFHKAVTRMADSGGFVFYSISKGSIHSQGITFYNKTKPEAQALVRPFLDSVSASSNGLVVSSNFTEFPSYFEHYVHYVGPLPAGNLPVGTTLLGGRLIPRSVLPRLTPTVRQLVDMGVTFNGFGINVTRFGQDGANSVLPQWRDSIVSAVLMLPFDFEAPIEHMFEQQNRITRDIQPIIEAATPGAGAYMNEGDFQQRDFQNTFFGANYPRLRAIKKKYDPEGVLYGVANVGSEDWVVSRGGRMCRSGR